MDDKNASLREYVNKARGKKFRPGVHDCATFAAGWVKECGGPDLMRGLRSKYKTLKSGRELAAQKGYTSELDVAVDNLKEVPRLMAQVGDVAWVDDGDSAGFGIVAGEIIFCLTPSGPMGHVALEKAARVFRV